MPSCAAAPSSRLIGFASRGPKSVIAPTPMKIRHGKILLLTPAYIRRRIPMSYQCAPSRIVVLSGSIMPVGSSIRPAPGRFASRIPNAMGSSRRGSNFLAMAR